MMISTKGRYALRVMIDLARHERDEFVSLKGISERQQISMKYLEAIVAVLNKADFLQSQRGKDGGYRLAKNPSEYTIGSVLKLTEGSLAPVACAEDNGKCENYCDCVTSFIWTRIYEATIEVVSKITLKDLAERSLTIEKTELECLK